MKKILFLLTLLLVTSLQGFSQTDTSTSYVKIPKVIVQETVRELIEKDYLEKRITIISNQLEVKKHIIDNNSKIVNNLERRIKSLQLINQYRYEQVQNYSRLTASLEKNLKRERTRKNFYKFSSLGVTVGLGMVIITQ